MLTAKKKIPLIFLLILALIFILVNNNSEEIKSYIDGVVKSPSTRIHLINIAKVAIPLKNLILMRNIDDKIALLKSSGSCVFCDLTQGNFKGNDLKDVDLRYAILIGANLSNTNLNGTILHHANLSGANLSGVDLSNTNLNEAILHHANLSGANLDGVILINKDLTGTILAYANLSGANLSGVDLSNKDLTGTILHHTKLAGANLDGIDLSNKDLTGINLSGVDLSDKDLTGTILAYANLSGANLDGVDLSNKDLTGINLSGVDLSNTNLNEAILHHATLAGVNLDGIDLSNKDLTGVSLSGVDLSNKDLTGTILAYATLAGANLDGVDLSNKDLTGVNLSGVDLSNTNLNEAILHHATLAGANLDGVDLSNKDLTGVNLSGVDLSNKDLTGTILAYANLSGANLDGVILSNKDLTGTILHHANLSGANLDGIDLSNKDLTGVNLSGVDLSNKDLTGTILKDAKKIEISLINPSNSSWSEFNEIQNLNITRYDLSGDVQYLATKRGFLFELKNNESRLVLDLNNDAQFPFYDSGEAGFLGIASQNELIYVSYSSKDFNELYSLVVDEYSMNFTKVRNIIKIGGFRGHFGGNLLFDSLGKLYLSVGVDNDDWYGAQDLNSLRGKILRLDVSKLNLEPEIVAYGIRSPWGLTIDSKDRMFILQCGGHNVEAVYLVSDLYSSIPANFGWPVFEGSMRKRKDPLMFNDVSAPIFETKIRPGCLTAGVYLNDIESFLFGDYHGTIRLLKQQENGDWYLLHEDKQENLIWGFGLDKKTKKIFVAPKNLELEILVDQVKLNQ